MKQLAAHASLVGLVLSLNAGFGLATPSPAAACGGFFCSSTPVDQNAERVVFKIRPDGRTDMVVQITYQGKAEDLGTFPQQALTSLDSQTGVVVQPNCFRSRGVNDAGSAAPSAEDDSESGVQIFVRATVGNYEVVVIGSSDPMATADWLKQNDFRISDAMLGFIDLYTKEGMKFLALKLLPEKTVNDITPFKLTLPGDTPSVPLRLSAVAAEPEMGIVVWVLGNQRYEPANAEELSIDNGELRYEFSLGQSNWLSLVARAVDAAQGRGFVVENAQQVAPLRQVAQNSFTSTMEQEQAKNALLELFADTTYLTRLYTRLSPEEMTFDPSFRRSSKGDVSRFRTISGDNQCQSPTTSTDPCDFMACGALGLCRSVDQDGAKLGACACADGSTARTTFVPDSRSASSFSTTVSCIDKRLSYLNPGDRNEAGEVLPDPCAGVDCGGHGTCVAMNMTPTCECEHGYVALGSLANDGTRSARCVKPRASVPDAFYNRRPIARDPDLPLGRDEEIAVPSGDSDKDDPVPEGNMTARGLEPGTPRSGGDDGGCSVSARRGEGQMSLFALAGIALAFVRSRRRPRR
jgi:hypothetical protein